MRIWPDATTEALRSEVLRGCPVPLRQLDQGALGLGRAVVAALRQVRSHVDAPLCGCDPRSHRFLMAGFTSTGLCGYPECLEVNLCDGRRLAPA